MNWKDFSKLIKFRLTFLVVFSASVTFLIGSKANAQNHGHINWLHWAMLIVGGFLVTGAANCFNEIIEKDYDKLMKRTKDRPIPAGHMTTGQALILGLGMAIAGTYLLGSLNLPTGLLSVFSILFYAFAYTPLKRVSPIAVFVGAIPGALAPFIGYVAGYGTVDQIALIVFGIQFVWQFPHFWAIAWVADDDYKKAGFKLLPSSGQKDLNTAIQIMIYTMFLIPLGLLPATFGITGINSAIVATVCGVAFFAQTFSLMRSGDRKSALKIMFGSFLYLPIVQIAYLLDKI
jgi:protoheme IX farnesyltransferase